MQNFMKAAFGATTLALIATSAQAQSEMNAAKTVTSETQTVETIDSNDQVGKLTITRVDAEGQAVLGVLEQQTTDAYIVQDQSGDLFINHLVPLSDLPDPQLEIDVVDTYQVTYRGVTYTNKIVGS